MDNGESSYRRFLAGDDSGMVELVREFKDGLMLYLRSYTDLRLVKDSMSMRRNGFNRHILFT